jgi:hypothetical protein
MGDIAPEDRGEIGVDLGGVAAPDIFHQRAHLMAGRDQGEAYGASEIGHRIFTRRVAIAVEKQRRNRPDSFLVSGFETLAGAREIDGPQHFALGRDPFIHS